MNEFYKMLKERQANYDLILDQFIQKEIITASDQAVINHYSILNGELTVIIWRLEELIETQK